MKSFEWAVEERHVTALRRNFKNGEHGEGPDAIVDSLIAQGVAKPLTADEPTKPRRTRAVAADDPSLD